jgi:hypothetical protein
MGKVKIVVEEEATMDWTGVQLGAFRSDLLFRI